MSADLASLLAGLTKAGKLKPTEFALGKTKVFLKNKASQDMDKLREEAFIVQSIKVQAVARRYVFKRRYKNWMKTIGLVKVGMANRSEPELVAAMDLMNELPHGGRHMK